MSDEFMLGLGLAFLFFMQVKDPILRMVSPTVDGLLSSITMIKIIPQRLSSS